MVELRKKLDTTLSSHIDRTSKPAIPERPTGLIRPSSLIRPQPRNINENADLDSGVGKL